MKILKIKALRKARQAVLPGKRLPREFAARANPGACSLGEVSEGACLGTSWLMRFPVALIVLHLGFSSFLPLFLLRQVLQDT